MSAQEWLPDMLVSPLSGGPLQRRGSLLVQGEERWPVIDGIPFLRADRAALAHAASDLVERGTVDEAAALLLSDQDAYAPDPPPPLSDCLELVRHRADFTFRGAMRQLAFGRVADYFMHRWSDPTYFSGLALAGLAGEGPTLELACGVGHFLRAFTQRSVEVTGADLVFAKLWIARHFISPSSRLICFDAATAWPLANVRFQNVFCHDAFYFLPDKPGIISRMRQVLLEDGRIAIGHLHNASVDNHSSGRPLTVSGYTALLPGAELFDDRELTASYTQDLPPRPATADALGDVPAVSLIWPGRSAGTVMTIRPGVRLRLNPLYETDGDVSRITWPSVRYEQEYAELATYPLCWTGPDVMVWDGSAETACLVRRGIYVDLPSRW